MPAHRYTIYGLRLDSFLPLPGLAPGDGRPEVEIRRGPVRDAAPGLGEYDEVYKAEPGRFCLSVGGVAAYLVKDGREIVVEPAPGAGEDDLRDYLAGPVMSALLYQRGFLPLHASAIEVGGRCVALAGHSGNGKSTLAAAFHQRGYRVLADDVVAVRARDGGPAVAYRGYCELKLLPDALAGLAPGGLGEIRPGSEKSYLSTGAPAVDEPLELSHVYLLGASDGDRFELEPLEGMRKLEVLVEYTYRSYFLEDLGVLENHFRLCVAVGSGARIVRVDRPSAGFRLEELARLVEADFLAPDGSR